MTERSPLRLVFVGDTLFDRGKLVPSHADREPEYYWGALHTLFQGDALKFCNLECSLFDQGRPSRVKTSPRLYSPPEKMLPLLDYLRFDVVSLGNNHLDDYGDASLLKTRDLLRERGFATFGAGADRAEARTPLIMDHRGWRVAFLGYTTPTIGAGIATEKTAGCNDCDPVAIAEDIGRVRQDVDLVVVSLHWGHEFYHYPSPAQIDLAHRIVDAGADIIAGHHPHCLQGVERYRGKIIIYSLGNFFLYNFMLRLGYPVYCNDFLAAACDASAEGLEIDCRLGRMDAKNRLRLLPRDDALYREFAGFCERLARPEYPAFWDAYREDVQRLLRKTLRDHHTSSIRSFADFANVFYKAKIYGWRSGLRWVLRGRR
jgi:hypothetical protein